ncbi:unnamed protein product [Prorocentrum cordatum]|uniref:Uncharacterized protein n=1 Tax=Prorocentrum cordatum TaxID=2364126 RepID=A0ABN9PQ52_9DINO|nr:unnamed protein product [Polarella glacialis]
MALSCPRSDISQRQSALRTKTSKGNTSSGLPTAQGHIGALPSLLLQHAAQSSRLTPTDNPSHMKPSAMEPPGIYEAANHSSSTICNTENTMVKGADLYHIEAQMVATMEPTYPAETAKRLPDSKCAANATGPFSTEIPAMKQRDPVVNSPANLCGASTIRGNIHQDAAMSKQPSVSSPKNATQRSLLMEAICIIAPTLPPTPLATVPPALSAMLDKDFCALPNKPCCSSSVACNSAPSPPTPNHLSGSRRRGRPRRRRWGLSAPARAAPARARRPPRLGRAPWGPWRQAWRPRRAAGRANGRREEGNKSNAEGMSRRRAKRTPPRPSLAPL